MSPIRIAAIILVITTGLVASYLIIKNSAPASVLGGGGSEFVIDGSAERQLHKNPPIEWTQKIVSFIANSSSSDLNYTSDITSSDELSSVYSSANSDLKSDTEGSSSANLTEFAANSLFNHMRSLDQGDTNPFTNFDPNNPESQRLLAEAVASIENPSSLFQKNIEDKDLKISSANSQEAKLNYLKGINEITKNRFSDPKYQRSSDEIITDINKDCFGGGPSLNQEMADLYGNLVNDYLNLNVPSEWLALHKQIISYFKDANGIYRALADCASDPIKGYVAAQSLPQLVTQAQNIQDLIIQKSKEINY